MYIACLLALLSDCVLEIMNELRFSKKKSPLPLRVSTILNHYSQTTNSHHHFYLYLASVGLMPFGTGRMGPVSAGAPTTGSRASGSGGMLSCVPSESFNWETFLEFEIKFKEKKKINVNVFITSNIWKVARSSPASSFPLWI